MDNKVYRERIKSHILKFSESDAYKAQNYQVKLTDELINSIIDEVNDSMEYIRSSGNVNGKDLEYLEWQYTRRFLYEHVSGMRTEKIDVSIPDPNAEKEINNIQGFTMLKEQLVDVLSTLTEREQKVLKLRYGLGDGRVRTLEEVAREFNVTKERIYQIEAKALRKLRHPTRSKKMAHYLDSE